MSKSATQPETTPPHEFAELFPLRDGQPLWTLADDIKENGQLEPIMLFEGKLLDGRRRELACFRAEVEPTYRNFKGNSEEALTYVVSRNLHRRDLTVEDRAFAAAEISKLKQGRPELNSSTELFNSASQKEAAAKMGISVATVKRARKIKKKGTPELLEAAKSGEVSLSDAAAIADKPAEAQNEAVKQVREKKSKTARAAVAASNGSPAVVVPELDADGNPIPNVAVLAFERAALIEAWGRKFSALMRDLPSLCTGPGTRLIDYATVKIHFKNGKLSLLQNRATHVCPLCHGRKMVKPCQACAGEGWTAAHVYKRLSQEVAK